MTETVDGELKGLTEKVEELEAQVLEVSFLADQYKDEVERLKEVIKQQEHFHLTVQQQLQAALNTTMLRPRVVVERRQ